MRKLITDIQTVYELLPSWMGRPFAFDVETTGLNWQKDQLLGLALFFKTESYYIALQHTMEHPLLSEQYHQVFIEDDVFSLALAPLFAQPEVPMYAHNAKFDMHFLHMQQVFIRGRLADTLLAAQLLDENRENGLKALAANLLNMEYAKYQTMSYYKGFSKDEILGAKLEDVAEYAMNDVEATYRLYELFMPELARQQFRDTSLLDVYNNLWMPLLVVLQEMEARGIALDIEKVQQLRDEHGAVAEEHRKLFTTAAAKLILSHYGDNIPDMYLKMATPEDLEEAYENLDEKLVVERDGVEYPIITYDMVGKTKSWRPRILTVNSGSNTQLYDIVYNLHDINLPEGVRLKLNKKGLAQADYDNLQTIIFYMGEDTPSIIRDLMKWRKATKFVSTYLDRFIADGDPEDFYAIHTWFAMAVNDRGSGGTATGRLSSMNPNLQNIPSRGEIGKQARSLFVARPEHDLIVADLAQAELRMLAHYSLDPELCKAFEEERDLHILTGAGFARMSYEELKEWYENEDHEMHDKAKELRMLGKTGNFALTYGMGPIKFQRYLVVHNSYEVSLDQAKEWIAGYNDTYSGARQWKQNVLHYARRNGYVMTFGGRRRRLPNITSRDRALSSYAERQAINAVIQGSVGDVICGAMIEIQQALKALGGTILLQVHDELVCEVPERHSLLAKTIIEDLLVKDCNTKLRVPQMADAHIGQSWAEAKG